MCNLFKKHTPFLKFVAKVTVVSFACGFVGAVAFNYANKDEQ